MDFGFREESAHVVNTSAGKQHNTWDAIYPALASQREKPTFYLPALDWWWWGLQCHHDGSVWHRFKRRQCSACPLGSLKTVKSIVLLCMLGIDALAFVAKPRLGPTCLCAQSGLGSPGSPRPRHRRVRAAPITPTTWLLPTPALLADFRQTQGSRREKSLPCSACHGLPRSNIFQRVNYTNLPQLRQWSQVSTILGNFC
jgi:hypothetical protein